MLTDNEIKLIKLISDNPNMTNSVAAEKMNMEPSGISMMLQNINYKIYEFEFDLKYLKNFIEINGKDIHFNKIKFLKKKKCGK